MTTNVHKDFALARLETLINMMIGQRQDGNYEIAAMYCHQCDGFIDALMWSDVITEEEYFELADRITNAYIHTAQPAREREENVSD